MLNIFSSCPTLVNTIWRWTLFRAEVIHHHNTFFSSSLNLSVPHSAAVCFEGGEVCVCVSDRNNTPVISWFTERNSVHACVVIQWVLQASRICSDPSERHQTLHRGYVGCTSSCLFSSIAVCCLSKEVRFWGQWNRRDCRNVKRTGTMKHNDTNTQCSSYCTVLWLYLDTFHIYCFFWFGLHCKCVTADYNETSVCCVKHRDFIVQMESCCVMYFTWVMRSAPPVTWSLKSLKWRSMTV